MSNAKRPKDYLPFLIAVGEAGSYKESMVYQKPFDTLEKYGLFIKHAPYKAFPQIKNLVTQDWPDENGEDVWLPKTGIVNKAYDFEAEFIYYADDGMATENIRAFANEIKGKWLQIYDSYTQMGRRGVYVSELDPDPPFKRRKIQLKVLDNGAPAIRDYVYFKVKFRVNDPNTDVVLYEGVAPHVPLIQKNGMLGIETGEETNIGTLPLTILDEMETGYMFVLDSQRPVELTLYGKWYYDSAPDYEGQTQGEADNSIILQPNVPYTLSSSILDFLCSGLDAYTGLSKLTAVVSPTTDSTTQTPFKITIYSPNS